MKKLLLAGCFLPLLLTAQDLTVEKIMRDPKWIGASPSGVFWSNDSRTVYFNWNPDNAQADSVYAVALPNGKPQKMGYYEAQRKEAESNARYNTKHNQIVYAYKGDIFWQDLGTGQLKRITQTADRESDPQFVHNDSWVVYNLNQNLFGWNIATGATVQFTNIRHAAEAAAEAPGAGRFGGGGRNGGGNRQGGSAVASNTQESWLAREEMRLMEVLKSRKDIRDARTKYLEENPDTDPDTLKTINVGDKSVIGLQISPDGRYISYRLYQAPVGVKSTIVPNYVTESGFTTDINGRSKVGAPQGHYELCIYDKEKESVVTVETDSIPGIYDQPDYVKDYPKKFANRRIPLRAVSYGGPYWNESGTRAIVDIRSQDHKDRWIMELDPHTGKLTQISRQRDEAWIGGPGISGGAYGANIGWVTDNICYYQSEATGYSHLYTYDLNTHTEKALTSGHYEVQDLELARDKQYFYLLTNEEHPGKQNWYRIHTDGTGKEKITKQTGGYEVSISPDEKWIAYLYSYTTKPWELYLQENAPGKKAVQVTDKGMSAEFKAYHWRDTKVITFPARDGAEVYGRVFEPKAAKKNGAAVIFVHGAGYLQNVHYWWSSYFRETMFNNLLADLGYTVMDIDYRASSGYGRDWRTAIYRHMGGKDLDDNVDAARWLEKTYGIDSARIGMYGGSYGGFMTLMALFTQPGVFKAGAALRPVTDWAHYNHGYTSEILNEPFNDSLAYVRSSPIEFASGLKDHLLICHGMVDQNVHFEDAVRLTQRLIELGKDNWSLAVFPMENHGFVEPSSWTDEYKRILNLFNSNLLK